MVSSLRAAIWSGLALLGLVTCFSAVSRADVAVPDRLIDKNILRSTTLPLKVEVDRRSQHSRITVPRRFINPLADPQGAQRDGASEGASRAPGARTVVAGLALSMAVAGFLVLRKRGTGGKTAMILLGLSVVTGSSLAVWADLAPPRNFRPRPQVPRHFINVEVGKVGNEAVLTLTDEAALELMKKLQAARRRRGTGSAPPATKSSPPRSGGFGSAPPE